MSFRHLSRNTTPQYNIGLLYERGLGVPQNHAEAAQWYRRAAERNQAQGQNNLGVLYEKGLGVPQDFKVAASWYLSAAEQGHAQAQNNLGVLYGNGRGVAQDMKQAYFWFSLAASRGSPNGAENRDFADRRLTPEEREQSQKIVREWRPKVAAEQ